MLQYQKLVKPLINFDKFAVFIFTVKYRIYPIFNSFLQVIISRLWEYRMKLKASVSGARQIQIDNFFIHMTSTLSNYEN